MQVRARTSVGYGINSTTLTVKLDGVIDLGIVASCQTSMRMLTYIMYYVETAEIGSSRLPVRITAPLVASGWAVALLFIVVVIATVMYRKWTKRAKYSDHV